jgi:predicted ATP-binding protein involved in virulence
MLKLKSLTLENYRGFDKLNIDFSDHVTCIAGINGAGKSSILDAVAKCLSWVTEMIKPVPQNGKWLSKTDVKRDSPFPAEILADMAVNNIQGKIDVGLDLNPGIVIKFADKPEMQSLYEHIQKIYPSNSKTLPVLMYYPVNRSDLDIDLSMEAEKDLSTPYAVYDNALDSVTHFKEFFRWFRDREDRENEAIRTKYDAGDTIVKYSDVQLDAVRAAIKSFLSGYTELKVARKIQTLLLKKHGEELSIASLSDGEKGIITLFGDIARRLAMANPESTEPLSGDGIILIDEIDLHLHPSWQRMIVPKLAATFPNCQFIVTTHSPQVLGELKAEDIRLLNNGEVFTPEQSYGLTTNDILEEVMDPQSGNKSIIRNEKIASEIQKLASLVDEEKFDEAKKLIASLNKETNGPVHEVRKYDAMIQMLEGDGM